MIKFSDLVVGAKFEVLTNAWRGPAQWRVGEVISVKLPTRSASARTRFGLARETMQAKIRCAYDSKVLVHFFLEDAFENHPRRLRRIGEVEHSLAYKEGFAAGKAARQAAKQMNFGHAPSVGFGLVDGLHPSACLERFEQMQREDPEFTRFVAAAKPGEVWLTGPQRETARIMWSARVSGKVRDSAHERAARATTVLCQTEED